MNMLKLRSKKCLKSAVFKSTAGYQPETRYVYIITHFTQFLDSHTSGCGVPIIGGRLSASTPNATGKKKRENI